MSEEVPAASALRRMIERLADLCLKHGLGREALAILCGEELPEFGVGEGHREGIVERKANTILASLSRNSTRHGEPSSKTFVEITKKASKHSFQI